MGSAETALLVAAFTVGLSGIFGLMLYKLVSAKGEAVQASDYGRKWLAWALFLSTVTTLPRFLHHLDVDSFARFAIAIIFFGTIAFVMGWVYGKLFVKFGEKQEEMVVPTDGQIVLDSIQRESIEETPPQTTHKETREEILRQRDLNELMQMAEASVARSQSSEARERADCEKQLGEENLRHEAVVEDLRQRLAQKQDSSGAVHIGPNELARIKEQLSAEEQRHFDTVQKITARLSQLSNAG